MMNKFVKISILSFLFVFGIVLGTIGRNVYFSDNINDQTVYADSLNLNNKNTIYIYLNKHGERVVEIEYNDLEKLVMDHKHGFKILQKIQALFYRLER